MRDKPKPKYTRGRPTARRRSAVSKALIELRRRMSQTQQSMAGLLGCALQSIARWETVSEPQGYTLHMLLSIAREYNYDDLSAVFEAALAKFRLEDRRRAEEIAKDVDCWREIHELLLQVEDDAAALGDKSHPRAAEARDAQLWGRRIRLQAMRLIDLTEQARRLAWRN